jgi:C1A family cysteine protease
MSLKTLFLTAILIPLSGAHIFEERFDQWLKQFSVHVHDDNHRGNLLQNWISNDKYIEEMNNKNLTYSLGHNHFSGMNSEEFSSFLNTDNDFFGKINPTKIKRDVNEVRCLSSCVKSFDNKHKLDTVSCVADCFQDNLSKTAVPDSINWVEKGAVTPVKDQGQCGSCWSFSTTGSLEGAYFIKNGNLESFSEQQLVDCDNRKNGGKDMGCNGGLMDNAFNWIEKNDGLCTEASYPYTSGTTKTAGSCTTSCSIVDGSDVMSFIDVDASSDDAMMAALAQQPVSIAIEADQKDFQLYKSGVFTGACGTSLDHGVLTVGYGSENGEDYYLVKNSWSNTWGDGGYIKLGRGSQYNSGSGQCGMLMQASYPIV